MVRRIGAIGAIGAIRAIGELSLALTGTWITTNGEGYGYY